MSTTAIAATIARRWERIEACFADPAEWRAFSGQLLGLLRDLDDPKADEAATTRSIEALFAASPAREALQSVRPPQPQPPARRNVLRGPWGDPAASAPASAPASASALGAAAPGLERHTIVNVLYGTDRAPLEVKNERATYADEGADALSFGLATVSMPDKDHHAKGSVERPRWYRLEFRENLDKHVVITALGALDEAEFIAKARLARQRDGSSDEALVFVHGYKVGFEDSIRRTAQFAYDLEFKGIAVAYSWPSKNSLLGYAADANVSESSMFRLADFISLLRSKLGLSRIHLVAHSMGNRLLARALNQHVLQTPEGQGAQLRQVVFAAPDIDPVTFGNFAKVFAAKCERCTLYASSRDLALKASRWIYRRPRAGGGAGALIEYGVDAIDVTKVDDSMLGHSYFSDKRVLLQDLNALLSKDTAPGDRFGLTKVPLGAGHYWEFDA